MTIEVRWLDDTHTTVLFDVRAKWSWNDLLQAMDTMYEMQEQSGIVLQSIVDMRAYNRMPLNPIAFGQNKMNKPMKSGIVVFVGAPAILQAIFDIFRNVYRGIPEKIRFCKTMEEAQAVVARQQAVILPMLDRL